MKRHIGMLCLLLPIVVWSQESPNLKKIEREADRLMREQAWHKALPLLLKLDSLDPTNETYNFKTGVCYYHTVDKELSLKYFKIAEENSDPSEELDFYIGRAYHYNHRFDDAIVYYNKFKEDLVELGNTDDPRFAQVEGFIKNCMIGKQLMRDSIDLEIKNIGGVINSEYPDYVPVIPGDESFILFTSRRPDNVNTEPDYDGQYYEDIFYAEQKPDGTWTEPENLGREVNTWEHDACIGLSFDGTELLIYKSANGGDIYVSHHNGDQWTKPEPLKGDVNTKGWESSASFTDDGKHLYFSSDRPGGFGGSDIYVAERLPDGSWGNVTNLGPNVNTEFDEDAPHIHRDDKTLFFSSRGHESMGGFDIFSSIHDETNNTWSTAKNIGYPINTADEDIYFTLSGDGSKAYFSSYRGDTYGEKDIYVLSRPNSSPTQFLFRMELERPEDLVGPVAAKIYLRNKATNAVDSVVTDDIFSGHQTITMEFDSDYDLEIYADGYAGAVHPVRVDHRADIFEYVMNVELQEEQEPATIVVDMGEEKEKKKAIASNEIAIAETTARSIVAEDVEEVKPFTTKVLQFDFDDFKLGSDASAKLDELAEHLKSTNSQVKIFGYTDTYGPDDYNLLLSQWRAKAAFDYLVNTGINAGRLTYEGKGESNPIADNNNFESRKLNRRVEFEISN